MQRRLDLALKKFYFQHPERKREIERLLEEARFEESQQAAPTTPPTARE